MICSVSRLLYLTRLTPVCLRFIHVLIRRAKYDIQSRFSMNKLLTCSGVFQPAPETEEEMMVEIFAYTERVVAMTRPRKLLFMAIGPVFVSFVSAKFPP